MHEINAEIINDVVYLSAPDLMRLCEASLSAEDTPYNAALKLLASQIKGMETEAYENILQESATQNQSVFAPLG